MLVSFLLGASRARATSKFATNSYLTRSLTSAIHPLVRSRILPPPTLIFAHQRNLSLGSIFSRTKTSPTPSPVTVAHITRLEAEANAHPQDLSKQLSLFKNLLGTQLKPAYDIIITRWERMCQFDTTSPLLQSDEMFQIYLSSLVQTGQEASINSAVRRRESLLASLPPVTTPEATVPEPEPAVPLSKSQEIANAVLAGQTTGLGSTATDASAKSIPVDSSKLSAAIAASGSPTGPIEVTITERKGSWIPRTIRFIFLTAMGGFLMLVVLAVLLENSGLMKAGPKTQQFEPTEGKTVKFSDVHGVDEIKDELQDVVSFLKDPSAFTTLGGKLPKGILLTGPPGTGKTLLARAVAGEAGVPFFFASGSDFEEMFVGVGAKRVRELFGAARKKQPAIIFIDELDAVGGKRHSKDQQFMKQTLNQLLTEMDGFVPSEGIIVIAATNFPSSLDQALVRPGRFDRVIAVPLPDVRGRTQILQHHMRDVTTAPEVDAAIIARGTPGFSGADLQNMVNQAAVQAAKELAKTVTLKHFEWAKDRIVMGSERKSHYLEPKVKLLTAYHEGGHALVAMYTDGAMPLHKVTCVPRGNALGMTTQLPENDRVSVSYKEFLAQIDVAMGGRVAEGMIYGEENITSGASSDIRAATSYAKVMVERYGFSKKIGPVYNDRDGSISTERLALIEEEIRNLVIAGETRVTALLKEKEDELHKLAHALCEHETLTLEEVQAVIKGEPIREIGKVLEDAKAEVEKTQTAAVS